MHFYQVDKKSDLINLILNLRICFSMLDTKYINYLCLIYDLYYIYPSSF